jgi:two-component sensor histidine kinase
MLYIGMSAGRALLIGAAGLFCMAMPVQAIEGGTDIHVDQYWLLGWAVMLAGVVLIGYLHQNRKVKHRTAELRRELFERQMAEKELLGSQQQLRQSLAEKEALLKEIHHRVKNNLQIVSSLLYLQEGAMQEPKGVELLRESQNRVKSMALIHEQLYGTDDLAKIDFGSYVHSLAANLFDAYAIDPASLRLAIHADDISLEVDMAVPCGLIINELVSNAIKHAFPSGTIGTIEIMIRVKGTGQMEIVVADDGVGLASKTDPSESPTLGLRLINTLTAQLDGQLNVDTGKGTRFSIIFNIPGYTQKDV